ncbi:hypothetical protein IPC725_13535 [Pseudomonas aeruginosa]|nr:hypothetical protein M003_18760 [Pseudomonas aeruginosa IGB83]RPX40997.1 hypothetical protein IPC725_13535 [Pseudomonas aeruginosa]
MQLIRGGVYSTHPGPQAWPTSEAFKQHISCKLQFLTLLIKAVRTCLPTRRPRFFDEMYNQSKTVMRPIKGGRFTKMFFQFFQQLTKLVRH